MNPDINLPFLKCKRCKHEWIPRTCNYPDVCPHCNSPYWNKERRKNMKTTQKKKDEEIGEMTEMAYYSPSKQKK